MSKILVFLIVAALFAGCASMPKTQTLNTLQPGITKQQLSDHFGGAQPVGSQLIDGFHVVKYTLQDSRYIDFDYYFVFDQNALLIGWEEAPKNKASGGGVSFLIPVPPLR